MSKYQPIDCHKYGEFERAIIAKRKLQLSWRGEGGIRHLETVKPEDLETCQGEEFLHFSNQHGATFRVRLDKILKATILPPAGSSSKS